MELRSKRLAALQLGSDRKRIRMEPAEQSEWLDIVPSIVNDMEVDHSDYDKNVNAITQMSALVHGPYGKDVIVWARLHSETFSHLWWACTMGQVPGTDKLKHVAHKLLQDMYRML